MTLYFEEEGEERLSLPCEELAAEAAKAVLADAGCPYEAQVNLLVTGDSEIHEMNRRFREIDRPTDVLSFPMVEYGIPADFDFLETRKDCFDPETGELVLGDIVISRDRVISQAEEYGHSKKREFAFLIVHSMLHLIGYDHIEEDERIVMEEKQRQLMDRLGIFR